MSFKMPDNMKVNIASARDKMVHRLAKRHNHKRNVGNCWFLNEMRREERWLRRNVPVFPQEKVVEPLDNEENVW